MTYRTYKTQQIKQVVEVLRKDGVVIFPSDTVWGVGALISSKEGVEKFYRIKQREPEKPSQVLVGSVEVAGIYGVMNDRVNGLVKHHWPGALTVVMNATEQMPDMVNGGRGTVGLRVPNHFQLLELLRELGEGLVASSANFAGKPAPQRFEEIDLDFLLRVNGVLEGDAGGTSSSTVVDATGEELKVLRQGEVRIDQNSNS